MSVTPSRLDAVREAFAQLDASEKTAFVLEATFSAVGEGLAETGRRFGDAVKDIDDLFTPPAAPPVDPDVNPAAAPATAPPRKKPPVKKPAARKTPSATKPAPDKTAGRTTKPGDTAPDDDA